MTKEEKIALCVAYDIANCDNRPEEFLASLTDDPAPTLPGDPLNRPIEMRLAEALEEVERARAARAMMWEKLQQHIVANQRPSARLCVDCASPSRRAVSAMREKLQQHIVANQRPDDPAPTLPGDPRAVELARYLERLAPSGFFREMDRKIFYEIAAILRRRAPAPGITLDDVERWMRVAADPERVGGHVSGAIAAMRKELGER